MHLMTKYSPRTYTLVTIMYWCDLARGTLYAIRSTFGASPHHRHLDQWLHSRWVVVRWKWGEEGVGGGKEGRKRDREMGRGSLRESQERYDERRGRSRRRGGEGGRRRRREGAVLGIKVSTVEEEE